ncbi:Golgi SNAP receptor complex member 1 isoform X2 [Plutella xylostella]|uniref:Golgi SNAP receptor complex member 1 isoform X1 n=1 Tax=Plutella xylostella TaxID=51655 RepID=UPI0018D0F2C8|nr:Golgi SNAP receptor complex member 1 isoform X1 [Plutella xylostella]XP_048482457.1 Golgi SNAP receptor complex member 1 isoform X2 [Plutella xylostella]
MSSITASSWEELRKQARILENDIDVKLVAFSKLGAGSAASGLSSESVPLLNSEDMFDTMSMELQQLLNKLSSINDKMADLAPNGAATMHTIKRHREILMDYQQEFSKTSERVSARREREELLRGSGAPPAAGLSRRDQYAKEASHLHSSHMLVDEQINIAMDAREHLNSQRQTFKRMQTTFNDITNRFPMLNSLIYRINARKRRDSLILGLVVAVCTFLMLLYAFH